MSKLQTVHLRVNDAITAKPTPCRIRISDADGNEYAPFGETVTFSTNRGESVGGRVRIGRGRWFSIPGACEIALPPGELRVQVCKGINYSPYDEKVQLIAGKMALRVSLTPYVFKPSSDMWIDTRCHFLAPHDAALDAAAMNLDVVNLLAEPLEYLGLDGTPYRDVTNLHAWSGQAAALQQHGSQIIVNTHNSHPVLGSLGLLHSHRPVFPLSFGGSDSSDDWTLRSWAEQCHRKGGLVVWTRPFAQGRAHAGEALALCILGQIDAFEISPENLSHALHGWYQLLNAGIRVPIVGASGRVANDRVLGAMQTETQHESQDWVQGVKSGFTIVSNGHVLGWAVRDRVAYTQLGAPQPFNRLQIIVDNQVVAEKDGELRNGLYFARIEHKLSGNGWVAARILDTRKSFLDETTPLFAHTSAQWIGEPKRDPKAVAFLMGHLEKAREWVETQGRFEDPKFRTQLLATFDEAKARLQLPPDFPPVPSPPGSAGGEG